MTQQPIICQTLDQLPIMGIHDISLAFGIFDSIHLGHQAILNRLIEEAEKTHSIPVIVTFFPLPLHVLTGKKEPRYVLSLAYRFELLRRKGVQAIVCVPFTLEFSQKDAFTFCQEITSIPNLRIHSICVGEFWRFGAGAKGTIHTLRSHCEPLGIQVIGIPEVRINHKKVSSSDIRNLIQQGDLYLVKQMLGRSYGIYGEVKPGKKIATQILHYPTANITDLEDLVLPPKGIYAATIRWQDTMYPGILYLGTAPTFCPNCSSTTPILEVHLFNFQEVIYHRYIEVLFLKLIRGERKFSTPHELSQQIQQDIQIALNIHQQEKGETF